MNTRLGCKDTTVEPKGCELQRRRGEAVDPFYDNFKLLAISLRGRRSGEAMIHLMSIDKVAFGNLIDMMTQVDIATCSINLSINHTCELVRNELTS